MGSDLSVVNAARVSFHKESDWEAVQVGPGPYDVFDQLSDKDAKLINYLARHGHWTPFGHAFLSFRIKAPIFVARQLVKHQVGLCWNEVSRRYVDDEPEFWFPDYFRQRADNVKQGSTDKPHQQSYTLLDMTKRYVEQDLELYLDMIADEVAPEQARMILPQNTMTEWIWSGSLMAFSRVVRLRTDPHAQEETRQVAQMIDDAVPQQFQHSWKALIGVQAEVS